MAKSLFPYIAEDGLMGYKDLDGNVKIAAQWDQVKSFGYSVGFLATVPSYDTAPARVRKGYKWGLINEMGDAVLPCEYDEITFREYRKRVFYVLTNYYNEEDLRIETGLASLSGKLLLPVSNGTRAADGDISQYVDDFDSKTTPPESEKSYINKQVSVKNGCLVDMDGNVLTEKFDHISSIYYVRAYVRLKTRSGVIDTDGNFVVPLTSKIKQITTFKQGYAECDVKTKDGFNPGIIDLWGCVKVLGRNFNPLYPGCWERERGANLACY